MPSALARQFATYLQALHRYAGTRRLMAVVALSTASAIVEGAGLLTLVPILDALDTDGRARLPLAWLGELTLPLAAWLGFFLLLVIARSALAWARDMGSTRLTIGYADHLRCRLQAALAGAEWRYLAAAGHAHLIQALTGALPRITYGTFVLLQLIVVLLIGTVALGVALSLSPTLTAITLAGGAALWWLARHRLSRAHQLGERLGDSHEGLLQSAGDFLSGLKLIKSTASEATHLARFAAEAKRLCAMELEFTRNQALAASLHTIGSTLLFAGLLLFAARGLALPKSELLVILLIFARLLPLSQQLQHFAQTLLHMLPAHADIQDLTERAMNAAEPMAEAASAPSLDRELRLAGVTYRHRADGAEVLSGIDLLIPARHTTALVGPSGAGKTTLADLLLGLTAPDAGHLEIDGIPLAGGARQAWRRSAGYVPQEAFLFPATVAENLRWAAPERTDAELWQALERAAAADFVRRLPQGLETEVGERGIRLSGGERQRIALARALLRRPQLLVLDEATSHLDSENERLIQHALEGLHGQLTLVVIAHRLSTVRHADRIVVIEAGRIVETGEWDSLVARGGRFRELFDAAVDR